MDFGYTYTFTPFSKILQETTVISDFSVIGIGLLVIACICMMINIYFLTPKIILIAEKREEKNKSLHKKKIVNRILMQKEIEDEIEKEIKGE